MGKSFDMVCCCVCVSTAEVAVIEKCGKFDRLGEPGCICLNPCCCEAVASTVSRRVEPIPLTAETKTQDDVFVVIGVLVNVVVEDAHKSYYQLTDPNRQIRANVPGMKLDEVFEKKDEIAVKIKDDLEDHLTEYGYKIISALVTEVEPERQVKDAMNRKNAATRIKHAAVDEAEAEKIRVVKAAEAAADASALAGMGIARQRKNIVDGLRDAVKEFGDELDVDSKEVMNIVLMTQYFDTLKEIGSGSRTSTIFVPTAPGAVSSA